MLSFNKNFEEINNFYSIFNPNKGNLLETSSCDNKISVKVIKLFIKVLKYTQGDAIGFNDTVLNELVECIYKVQKGGTYISPTLHQFLEKREAKELSADWTRKYQLTLSELNVLKLVGEGKTTKEIAEILFVSEKTIETHRGNCVKKLGLEGGKNALMKFLLENKGMV